MSGSYRLDIGISQSPRASDFEGRILLYRSSRPEERKKKQLFMNRHLLFQKTDTYNQIKIRGIIYHISGSFARLIMIKGIFVFVPSQRRDERWVDVVRTCGLYGRFSEGVRWDFDLYGDSIRQIWKQKQKHANNQQS